MANSQCSSAGPANVLIALGSNRPGPWGGRHRTLKAALSHIESPNTHLVARSPIYESLPMGQPGQGAYLNAVAAFRTSLSPEALLKRLKSIENQAGRRGMSRPWGPRSLDLDILDYAGVVTGWRGARARFARPGKRPLILPHPHLHHRAFVLQPLLDLAPDWRHPVLKDSARAFLRAIPERRRGLRPAPCSETAQGHGNP